MTRQPKRPDRPARYRVVWPTVWDSNGKLHQGQVVELSDRDAEALVMLGAVEPV